MKKIFKTTLIVAMTFTLFGCTSNTKQDSTKEETFAQEEVKEEKIEEPKQEIVQSTTVNPDLKAFLDSYESFMDEYVEYMKKLEENPTDAELMLGYADIMMKYADFVDKIDKYDTNSMSEVDAAYYLEVQARVLNKLASVE